MSYYGYYSDEDVLKLWGIGGLIALVLAGILFFLINPHQADATVVDYYWTHQIDVEQYNRHQEESDTVRSGATVISRRWGVTGGYLYTYQWWQWDVDHILQTQAHDRDRYWPTWADKKPNQRLGQYREIYTLVFVDKDDKVLTFNLDYDHWRYFNVKDKVSIQVNHFGVVTEAHVTEANTPY